MDIGPTSGVLFSFRFNESALENLLFSKEGLEENSFVRWTNVESNMTFSFYELGLKNWI